jgi:hypothetical protein
VSYHVYDVSDLAVAYPLMLKDLENDGQEVSPRGKPNLELRPVLLITSEHAELAGAGVSYKFAHAEAMAYLAGWNDVAWLKRFNPRVAQFSDDGLTFHGAYGKRLESQLKHAVARLQADRESRQVVLNVWSIGDLWVTSKDLPCNTQLLLKLRDDALHLTAIVRSQDVIWGLPYDHHAWWVMCKQLAHIIGCRAGTVTHFIDSLHLYLPAAGFYDAARVEQAKAATHRPAGLIWPLPVASLCQLREELLGVRKQVEDGVPLSPLAQRLL